MADLTTLRADADAPVTSVHLGEVAYDEALALQERLGAARASGEIGDVLLLLQHPRVYTAGRRADRANLLFDDAELTRRGIEVRDVDRGGDFTYHGPGQLVAYPILRLARSRGVVDYVRGLEEVGIRVAARHGVEAARVEDFTGVWVGAEKLMAIGVRIAADGITKHGLAINVTTDLGDFGGIVPCGIDDKGVCSLQSLGVEVDVPTVADELAAAFGDVFGCEVAPGALP